MELLPRLRLEHVAYLSEPDGQSNALVLLGMQIRLSLLPFAVNEGI